MIGAIGADFTPGTGIKTGGIKTVFSTDPNAPADPTVSTAAAAQPFYKDPVTYAVVGGGILAAIGGWMLLGKKRRR